MKVRGFYHVLLSTSIRGLLEEWELHPGGGGTLPEKVRRCEASHQKSDPKFSGKF